MTNQTHLPAVTAGLTTPQVSTFQSEVDPAALQKLFSADPESLSDQDIATIVTKLRKDRELFAVEEAAKAMKEKKPKAKAISSDAAKQLSLDDLGL